MADLKEKNDVKLNDELIAEFNPKANKEQIILGDNYRISVLTAELIRVEVSEAGAYTDQATQSVWNRDYDKTSYQVKDEGTTLIIETAKVAYYFNKSKKKITHIKFNGDNKLIKCSNKGNLLGTARTLDGTFGSIPLNYGIMSKSGVAILDDSNSLLMDESGEVKERDKSSDLYIFAYGRDYLRCLKDFFQLCGKSPLIPRYALGNWWSRYRAYTADEYINLMQRFIDSDIPITVATVDMDWHWVDVNERFGDKYNRKWAHGGWTGYSWNSDLFPDYKAFLAYLKENNFKVTLNLHPADGVRAYEDMYKEMAIEMGIDPESGDNVVFDITNPQFINAYFKILHHPYEKLGVDFWWIDWQQGKKTKVKGLDPLWALNHYHYLDNGRNTRGIILSRYAGVGSHRYPLGFSGDTAINWKVFDFQPYFTSTASNIGYCWWSHDIGGHHLGKRDDELYLRWVQLGVFSPIMRLHSTSSDLLGKEPWNYRLEIERYTIEQLRLRHRLIPYIYSMNYLSYSEGKPLVQPMYYAYPYQEQAYNVPNQFYYGSELIVAPITTKMCTRVNMGSVDVWLPEGRWTDIFNGNVYQGNKIVKMLRGIESIPVLAKEGAIIPLSDNKGNDWKNPVDMTILAYYGNNSFSLYEDNGEDNGYKNGEYAITEFNIFYDKTINFTINPAQNDLSVIPDKRNYRIEFKDIKKAGEVNVLLNGKQCVYTLDATNCVIISVNQVKPTDKLEIILSTLEFTANEDYKMRAIKYLARYQGNNVIKIMQYKKLRKCATKEAYLAKLNKLLVPRKVKQAIMELE